MTPENNIQSWEAVPEIVTWHEIVMPGMVFHSVLGKRGISAVCTRMCCWPPWWGTYHVFSFKLQRSWRILLQCCKSAFFLLPSFLFRIYLFSRQYSSCGAQVERLPARTLDPRDPLEIGVKCSSRKIIRDSCLCANMAFPNGLASSLLTHTVQMKLPMASIWPLITRSPSHGPLFVRVGPFHNWA